MPGVDDAHRKAAFAAAVPYVRASFPLAITAGLSRRKKRVVQNGPRNSFPCLHCASGTAHSGQLSARERVAAMQALNDSHIRFESGQYGGLDARYMFLIRAWRSKTMLLNWLIARFTNQMRQRTIQDNRLVVGFRGAGFAREAQIR
jgi:hypothetical protein